MVVAITATATTYKALGDQQDPRCVLRTRAHSGHPPFSRRRPGARRGSWLLGSQGAGPRRPGQAGCDADPCARQTVVGDAEFHHFRYRVPPERVRLMEVGGDLQLESVKIF